MTPNAFSAAAPAGSHDLLRTAALAYAGAATDYVSSTPKWLRAFRLSALAAVTVWAACFIWLLAAIDSTTRTIGHDATPSIVAAERVRSLLADANGNFASVLLVRDADDGPFMSAFRQDVRDAATSLAQAANNVTYGEEETGPIVTMMRGIAEYEHRVGQARGKARGAGPEAAPENAKLADTLMHFTILPAAAALDRVNFEHLSEAYDRHRTNVWTMLVVTGLSSVICLGVLAGAQYWLLRRTKRIVNVGLFVATCAVAIASTWGLGASITAEEQIRVAKVDAFDSVFALTTAQFVANDANAAESFRLLAHGDVAAQDRFEKAFVARSARLVGKPVESAQADVAAGRKFNGLLGDELANITFEGEREAADATLAAWGEYLKIDLRIRDLERSGKTDAAVALSIGSREGQSNWAFARFDSALEKVLAINQRAFANAISASEALVNKTLYGIVLAAWLIACLGAWIGVGGRLREYEF